MNKAARAMERERVASALQFYDRYLYGLGATVKRAREFLKQLGLDVTGIRVGKVAEGACAYWRKGMPGRVLRRDAYTADEWHRMRLWLRRHDDSLDAERDTLLFVTRWMNHCGVRCSARAAAEVLRLQGVRVGDMPARAWRDRNGTG